MPDDESNEQSPQAQSAAAAPSAINDPPIQYDPVGQALVSLPFAIGSAAVSAVETGASVASELGPEILAWGAAELGINGLETPANEGQGNHPNSSSSTPSSHPEEPNDGGAPPGGAPDPVSDTSVSFDPAVQIFDTAAAPTPVFNDDSEPASDPGAGGNSDSGPASEPGAGSAADGLGGAEGAGSGEDIGGEPGSDPGAGGNSDSGPASEPGAGSAADGLGGAEGAGSGEDIGGEPGSDPGAGAGAGETY